MVRKTKSVASTELINIGDGFDDDCPICQALRAAEKSGRKNLTAGELRQAFEAAKKIPGAIVGGFGDDFDVPDDEPVETVKMDLFPPCRRRR